MSWWGGGEIRPTPGVEYRIFAMYSLILRPGNWPPSPGLDPWAILICNWSALTRYSVVTPKRPLATCFMALRRLSPFSSGVNRLGSSPPSPVLDLPPMRFIAMARVSCASLEREPSDIAPGREALDDLPGRLDLFYRDGVLLELEEAAQRGEARAVLVEVAGELLEGLEVPGLDGPLQRRDARLVPLVVLALRPELVLAPDLELLGVVLGGREGAPVALEGLARRARRSRRRPRARRCP